MVANGGLQIDLVIITAQRCLNVELKYLDTELPLIATPNGPWRQLLPDGADRSLDRGQLLRPGDPADLHPYTAIRWM